jgi:hypothetical protein
MNVGIGGYGPPLFFLKKSLHFRTSAGERFSRAAKLHRETPWFGKLDALRIVMSKARRRLAR